MTYAVVRRSVRVLAVDDRGRLLMLRVDGREGRYFEAPGGGVEPGESVAEAAARELVEETGYADVEIGDPVAWRWVEYERAAGRIGQEEVFVVARVPRPEVRGTPTEPDPGEHGHVWLRRGDLRAGAPTEPDAPALLLRVTAGDTTPERLPDVHHGVEPLAAAGVGPDDVLAAALRVLREESHLVARLARAGVPPWTDFHADGLVARFARSSAFVREHRATLV